MAAPTSDCARVKIFAVVGEMAFRATGRWRHRATSRSYGASRVSFHVHAAPRRSSDPVAKKRFTRRSCKASGIGSIVLAVNKVPNRCGK